MNSSTMDVLKKAALTLGILILLGLSFSLEGQCPMCRMSAESNLANGGTAGASLNSGILYMLTAPYLLVAGIAFLWWKNRRLVKDDY